MRVACGCYLFGSFSTLYTVVCARGLNSYDDIHHTDTTHWIICKGNLCAWCGFVVSISRIRGWMGLPQIFICVASLLHIHICIYIMLWNGILIEYLTWIIMKFGKVPVRINFDHNCNYKQTPHTQRERERESCAMQSGIWVYNLINFFKIIINSLKF